MVLAPPPFLCVHLPCGISHVICLLCLTLYSKPLVQNVNGTPSDKFPTLIDVLSLNMGPNTVKLIFRNLNGVSNKVKHNIISHLTCLACEMAMIHGGTHKEAEMPKL